LLRSGSVSVHADSEGKSVGHIASFIDLLKQNRRQCGILLSLISFLRYLGPQDSRARAVSLVETARRYAGKYQHTAELDAIVVSLHRNISEDRFIASVNNLVSEGTDQTNLNEKVRLRCVLYLLRGSNHIEVQQRAGEMRRHLSMSAGKSLKGLKICLYKNGHRN
jgi:hypothetical protein